MVSIHTVTMIKYRSGGGKGEDQNEFNEASYFCILNLPTDLIHKIFSRLQLKYILRSRVVCRAWYNLFSVPDFMHHYAKNTPFTTLLLSHYQQAVTATEHHTFSFVEISEEGDCTRTTIEPKLPFCRKQDSFLSIKGSCNGLLCLLLHNSRFEVIYIYNPTSGESISLPVHTFDKYERAYLVSLVYEFGFSPSTNNFKVLKINHQKTINGERVQQCEIFTVGVDHKWRQLEFSFKVGYYACRIALNWAVCWFARDLDSTNYIAAFDFGKEEVGLISHPHGLLLKYMELAFLNNRLRLLDYSIPSHYTMWTMEEYGVAESWTKIVISRSCFPSCAPLLWQCPIAILQNGNLLFRLGRGKGFMCYNPTQKECTVVEVPDDVQQFIYYIKEFAPIRLGA